MQTTLEHSSTTWLLSHHTKLHFMKSTFLQMTLDTTFAPLDFSISPARVQLLGPAPHWRVWYPIEGNIAKFISPVIFSWAVHLHIDAGCENWIQIEPKLNWIKKQIKITLAPSCFPLPCTAEIWQQWNTITAYTWNHQLQPNVIDKCKIWETHLTGKVIFKDESLMPAPSVHISNFIGGWASLNATDDPGWKPFHAFKFSLSSSSSLSLIFNKKTTFLTLSSSLQTRQK